MNRDSYVVIAHYDAHPGGGDAVAEALQVHGRATRKEPGCIGFVAHRNIENPDQFALYEVYKSEADWRAHQQTPHFHKYVVQTIRSLLKERDVEFYRPLGDIT